MIMTPTLSPVNDKDYAQIVTDLLPEIRKAVSIVCLLQRHSVRWDEIEDLCQQTALLLIQSDYRRLRSFDHTRSSLKTWLRAVIRNHLRRYEKKQHLSHNEEKVYAESFGYWPFLETEILYQERGTALEQAVVKLTKCEKQLYELLCRDDLNNLDRARLLGIKVETLHWRKHALIRKLQKLINSE
jgi:RNA polymerase sigma factor (sigma-70 family)